MPPNKAPSSSVRWPSTLQGLVGLLVAAGLAWWGYSWLHRDPVSSALGPGVPSATARARRAPPPVGPAARRRAGLAGHVVDLDRKPVAAASVCAWASPGTGLVTLQTRAPRCATTDDAGAYALTDLFPATPLSISAAAPGFAPRRYRAPDGGVELRLADGEQRAGVDVVLGGGGVALKGSVNDATGGGVAGALVVSESGGERAATTSDAKGEFTLWVEPGPTNVSAAATGYAPGWASGPAPEHVFKIHLVPGATLVGRAVIAGGDEPVSGVMIEGIQVEGGYSRASTRTDDEGRFQLAGLMPGRYRVEATSESREGYSGSSITLGMGETSAEVRIELDPAYVVRGRVVDKATGEPCHGGQVTITDTKQNEYSQTEIEPDGWARMASVIPGTYRVQVRCKDHVDSDDYPTVVVKDADAPPLSWPVDKGASVRVEVVDDQGHPVTKATVSAQDDQFALPGRPVDHVEADGTFLLAGLKPGAYSVSVDTGQSGRAEKTVTVAQGREERLKMEIPSAGIIDGVVEDEAHQPVPYVQVVASGPIRMSGRALDDGTFSLSGLPSGEYQMEVRGLLPAGAATPEERDAHLVKVTVTAPGHAKVRVSVAGRSGTIEGRVTDGAGRAVTDAFIDFALASAGRGVPRYGGSSRAPVLTDTEGHFTVEGLADGEYNLRAYRKGGGEATADQVKVGTHDLALKLGEGGSIAGMFVMGARGAGVERFSLTVRDTNTTFGRQELFFHAGGAFALHDLPAGTYQVDAETPDGAASAEVTLAEGEQKSGVTLTMALRGAIDGRVVDGESGAPIAGVELLVEGNSRTAVVTGDNRNSATGADGHFHLEGVLAGQWSLMMRPPGSTFAWTTVPIEVREDGGLTDLGVLRLAHRPAPDAPADDAFNFR